MSVTQQRDLFAEFLRTEQSWLSRTR